MKRIGFLGAIDKSDLLVNVAKILEKLGYSVLVVDSSSTQKIKYIVPSINPTRTYITSFENVDFGVGFANWEDVEKYLGIKFDSSEDIQVPDNKANEKAKNGYDYVLIDVDSKQALEGFEIDRVDKRYFLTKFDKFSLTKGMNMFENLEEPMDLTKILFSYTDCTKEDEDYLNFISSYYKINWNEYELYFKILGEDNKIFEDNQKIEKIRLNKFSANYKESLAYLVQDMDKANNMGKIKKTLKD